PKNTEVEAKERKRRIEASLKHATEVPLQTARAALDALQALKRLRPICNQNALSDLGVAALMAQASAKGAAYNVNINLASIEDVTFKTENRAAIAKVVAEAEWIAQDIERSLTF